MNFLIQIHQKFKCDIYIYILVNFFFQERIYDGEPCLPVNICESIVFIIRCMIGSPPESRVLEVICNVLLLLHPAATTFIYHDAKQLYYTPKWGKL